MRLNIPWDQPLAVQQWEGLIAVNYAARASGVVRHDRVSEALHKVYLDIDLTFVNLPKFLQCCNYLGCFD